ncbi:MAG: hypothetical protein IPP91_19485 [Betaproteobacteria bacterium]|nr:hypothetical protein [Betaproteobacteria bacterium]
MERRAGQAGPGRCDADHLRQARIWAERAGESWISAEFVHPEDEARPFRQRIYRIGEGAGLITAIVYRLPGDSIRYAGEWRKPRPFEALSPADLTERKGCRIEIPPGMPIAFAGSTPGRECAPESPGAAYEEDRLPPPRPPGSSGSGDSTPRAPRSRLHGGAAQLSQGFGECQVKGAMRRTVPVGMRVGSAYDRN